MAKQLMLLAKHSSAAGTYYQVCILAIYIAAVKYTNVYGQKEVQNIVVVSSCNIPRSWGESLAGWLVVWTFS